MNSKLFCSKCNIGFPFLKYQSNSLKNHSIYLNQLTYLHSFVLTKLLDSDKNGNVFKSLHYSTFSNKFKDELLKSKVLNQNLYRTALKGGPGYTNYGHGKFKKKFTKFSYFWYAFLAGGLTFALFFDFEKIAFNGEEAEDKIQELKNWYSRESVPKAKERQKVDNSIQNSELNTDIEENIEEDEEKDPKSEKKNKNSFRERKIIEYENRLRKYATPDKAFRYFATIKIWNEKLNDYMIFMTPDDFVRAITYGAKQPEGLGLDTYNKFDPRMQKLDLKLSDDSVFKRLSPQGLISFSDYVFLTTMLSTPTRHFEIAFHMFDLDGSGNIDIGEFEQLQTIIRNQTSLGQRHRDTRMTGSVLKENSTLNEYFFGPELSDLLTVQKFIDFQKKLQSEVIKMEFEYCEPKINTGNERKITEISFCEMILNYAQFNKSKNKKLIKRIGSIYNEDSPGISFKEYEDFFKVLRSIQDIDTALKFYAIAGASIDKSILKHVSKTVAGVDLSDHVVEVVFNLFDENGDGKLSQKEFIKVMKRRWMRGLQIPKDTGFLKFIQSLGSCAKESIFS